MKGADLAIRDLRVSYGRIEVVHGISLRAAPGQVTCLIGANGAGKTTTMETVLGLIRPTSGSITVDGAERVGRPTDKAVRVGIGVVPQGRRVFPSLTVLENLRMGVVSSPKRWSSREALADVYSLFPVLEERQTQLAGTLSGGEQQMLALGRALMSQPRLLLLDEPSMGLAPKMVERVFEVLWSLRDRGITMLLAEQNARLALAVSDEAYVLESGVIEESGPCEAMRSSPRVQEIYLGA